MTARPGGVTADAENSYYEPAVNSNAGKTAVQKIAAIFVMILLFFQKTDIMLKL